MASPDVFDAYFRRADADGDGRISGQEAVTFFQGTNLNREILAKIWQYADQGKTGFLSKPEFYNALKLVTVAQTGRELTPAIVSRALQGPAASQIPAPQIQLAPGPTPVSQVLGAARPVRPLGPPPQQSQHSPTGVSWLIPSLTPGPQPTILTSQLRTPTVQTFGGSTGSPAEWATRKSSSWPGPASSTNLTNQNIQIKAESATPPQGALHDVFGGSLFQAGANLNATKAPPSSSAEPDLFGGDIFTAVPVKPPAVPPQQNMPASQPSVTVLPTNLPTPQAPQQRGIKPPVCTDPTPFALVPTVVTPAAASNQLQPVAMPVGLDLQDRGFGTTPGNDGAKMWPKMIDSVVQRYTKVFFEVDTDKDGKISGIQARDLFLSWQIPREVLKQIWDLSDQDHDSMLSLREFCTALYIMERYREGLKLPAAIPSVYCFDESGIQALRIAEAQVAVAQNSAGHNLPAWQHNPGHTVNGLPPRPVPVGSVLHQTPAPAPPKGDGFIPSPALQQKSRAPVLEMNLVNQLNADDQLTLQTKHQEALDAEKKVLELEKEIMDFKEKMDYYRSKLQDVVVFKTRCDNRLNEITERAAADKREVESLAKRYDEKFKQAGQSQSRLLGDEAAFHDIQERRLELYNAILRMEQGGDDNALPQSHADRLDNDLDELRRALNAKCKHFGLRIKPTSLVELPSGWQPGMQENAVQWDEDWDKFHDEGFAYVQEFVEEGSAGNDAAKPTSIANWDHDTRVEDGFEDPEILAEERPSSGHAGSLSPQAENDDGVIINGDSSQYKESSPSNPGHLESDVFSDPTTTGKELYNHNNGFSSSKFEADSNADNGGDWASVFSHRRDDTDLNASWLINDTTSSKALVDKSSSAASFEFSDPFDMLSTNTGHAKDAQEDLPSFRPIRTKETSSVFFDNSVPSTPLYNDMSPARSSSGGFFDSQLPSREQFVRFNSFSSNINDVSQPSNIFARFDSFSSIHNAGGGQDFTPSFDDNDPFSGTGPFGGGQTPKKHTDTWSSFS